MLYASVSTGPASLIATASSASTAHMFGFHGMQITQISSAYSVLCAAISSESIDGPYSHLSAFKQDYPRLKLSQLSDSTFDPFELELFRDLTPLYSKPSQMS
ncbi:hypothetical protein BDW74DRAFT_90399 [Aspergillus multicolor]|uniref:uncharacterized protein n=1 Tax=Aspergillus multicolor TaxID=41759 RepID=UPI003CCD562C